MYMEAAAEDSILYNKVMPQVCKCLGICGAMQ